MAKNKKQKPWVGVETIPDINMVMLYPVTLDYEKRVAEAGGGKILSGISWLIREGMGILQYHEDEFKAVTKFLATKAIADVGWLEQQNRKVYENAKIYFRYAKQVAKVKLGRISNEQLLKLFDKLISLQYKSHSSGQATTWLIDADEQNFSSYLSDYLKSQIKKSGGKFALVKTFTELTTSDQSSFLERENYASLLLAREIKQHHQAKRIFLRILDPELLIKQLRKNCPALFKKIKRHQAKWFWLHYNYRGPVLQLDYFLEIWRGLIKDRKLGRYIKEAENRAEEVKSRHRYLVSRLHISSYYRRLFRQARYIVWLKGYRKDCMYFGAYIANEFLREMARRLYISFRQAEFLTWAEYRRALLGKKFNPKELSARFQYCLMWGEKGKVKIVTGDRARKLAKRIIKWKKRARRVSFLRGQTASPGKARGKVKIIEMVADLPKMNEGDIMLSETTYPALVPAMKQAAAIVTNVGGLTCHAAIVSRELKKPCVVGTKIATEVLRDGDEVEVDANKGIVKVIKNK